MKLLKYADVTKIGNLVKETVTEMVADDVQRSSEEDDAFLVHDRCGEESVGTSQLINLTCGLGG